MRTQKLPPRFVVAPVSTISEPDATKCRPRVSPWIIGALGSAAGLSGCGLFPTNPSLDSPNALANVWSREMARYDIQPVFPPREDIQIGDIYLLCAGSDPKNDSKAPSTPPQNAPLALWVARLPGVMSALKKQEMERSVILPTLRAENSAEGAGSVTPADVPEKTGGSILGAQGELVRLKSVSFPDFNTDKVDGASLDGLLPTGISLLSLGMHYADIRSARISIPQAGTVGLPTDQMLVLLRGPHDETINNKDKIYENLLNSRKETCKKRGYLDATYYLVNEIFTAHQINFQVEASGSQQYGLGGTIDLPTDSARKRIWDAYGSQAVTILGNAKQPADSPKGGNNDTPTDGTTKNVSPTQGVTSNAEVDNLVARTRALLDFVDQPTSLTKPGLKIQYLSAEGYGVSVERHYNHPVVIGVRGFPITNFGKPDATIETFVSNNQISGSNPTASKNQASNSAGDGYQPVNNSAADLPTK